MPDIICRDADASVFNVGYQQDWLPSFGGALYGFYLLGTAAPLDVLRDYSGNDRHLTRAGEPVENASHAAVGAFPAGYLTPFTGDQLLAAGANAGATIAAVIRTGTDGTAVVTTCSDGSIAQHMGLLTNAGNDCFVAMRNGGSGSLATGTPEFSTARAAEFAFVAGRYTPTQLSAFRKYAAGTMVQNNIAATFAPAGPRRFGIGRFNPDAADDNTYPDPVSIAAIAYFSAALTNDQMNDVYAGMKAAVAASGGTAV